MNLYLISQNENTSYEAIRQAVVAAPSAKAAKYIHPTDNSWSDEFSGWASSPANVQVKYLGEAHEGTKASLILASEFFFLIS